MSLHCPPRGENDEKHPHPSSARRGATVASIAGWLVNRTVGLILLVLLAPLLLVLVAVIWALDGWPPVYVSRRLGRDKRIFPMFKLRTLVRRADQIKGRRLVRSDDRLFLPCGRFLRDTRIDELPQLLNIVLGHMDFLGPRPERPEVYEDLCRDIPGYEHRFRVRPGLVGPSQLFTPHCTDKRYRTLLDNGMLRHSGGGPGRLSLVLYAGLMVVVKAHRRLYRFLSKWVAGLWHGKRTWRRRFRRVQHAAAKVRLLGRAKGVNELGANRTFELRDISDEALAFESEGPIHPDELSTLELVSELESRNGTPRLRQALCHGELLQVRRGERSQTYVLSYEPEGARSEYVVGQYFLHSSLASPRWRRPASRPTAEAFRPEPARQTAPRSTTA